MALIFLYMNVKIASNYIATSVEGEDAQVVAHKVEKRPVNAGNNGKHNMPAQRQVLMLI